MNVSAKFVWAMLVPVKGRYIYRDSNAPEN